MTLTLIALVALVAAAIGLLLLQNLSVPGHLGHINGQLAEMPNKPNAVSTQTESQDKKVAPLPFQGNLEQTRAKVVQVLSELGDNNIQTQDDRYIYSVFTTKLMRYRDDVEFYLDEATQLVHFRSQSRAGYSDMGVNKQRYLTFKQRFMA